jgi:hypothetical protein
MGWILWEGQQSNSSSSFNVLEVFDKATGVANFQAVTEGVCGVLLQP